MRAAFIAIVVASAASASAAEPGSDSLSAEQIAERAFASNFLGLTAGTAVVRVTLVNSRNEQKVRRLQTRTAQQGGQRRTMVRFTEPADIRGMAFLVLEKKQGDDDQYLFMPALGRTRRIAGSQRNGAFIGDVTYDDMQTREVSDATWKRLPDDQVGELPCYRLEAVPVDPKREKYGRTEIWVHKDTWLPLRMRSFDKHRNTLARTLVIKKFEQVAGRWLARQVAVRDERKKHTTWIDVESIDLDTPVAPELLTPDALPKG